MGLETNPEQDLAATPGGGSALNVLVLCDPRVLYTNTVLEHLESFARYSRQHIFYTDGTNGLRKSRIPLEAFDVVVLHYSVRMAYTWHIHPGLARQLESYDGLKIQFIQDEYDGTDQACAWMKRLGIHVVFTCVPPQHVALVYPPEKVGPVEFIHNLTGYVPLKFERPRANRPLSERKWQVGYRGRSLAFHYGKLAREKMEIGARMEAACEARGVPCDIEWMEDKRIYGPAWYEFLEDCRATLGSESGSNVFDRDGSIRRRVEAALAEKPGATFEEIYRRYVEPYDGPVAMNQVSPRVFEAIAVGTGLILYEGSYSGVVQPDVHFIPLRKDFGNVDEVLAKVRDIPYLQEITERAYRDVILSGRYSYRALMGLFDDAVSRKAATRPRALVLPAVMGQDGRRRFPLKGLICLSPGDIELERASAVTDRLSKLWRKLPPWLRVCLRPAARFIFRRGSPKGAS